ncbi:hypothetical protein JB92DRAFT_1135463 [Gautieria morchelliformis]|nr:hypothetical protein JB92DRAFT_1135463 [Gautieria morchelliformis]
MPLPQMKPQHVLITDWSLMDKTFFADLNRMKWIILVPYICAAVCDTITYVRSTRQMRLSRCRIIFFLFVTLLSAVLKTTQTSSRIVFELLITIQAPAGRPRHGVTIFSALSAVTYWSSFAGGGTIPCSTCLT